MQPFPNKGVLDTIVKSSLSSRRLIVSTMETAGMEVRRAVNEYCIHNMEKASTTAAGYESLIEVSLSYERRPSKVSPESKSREELHFNLCRPCSLCNCTGRRKSVSVGCKLLSDTKSDKSFESKSSSCRGFYVDPCGLKSLISPFMKAVGNLHRALQGMNPDRLPQLSFV